MLKRNILLFVVMTVLCSNVGVLFVHKALAAACNPTNPVGNVSLNADIPASGEYVVWIRMQAPAPADEIVRLEVNGDTCYRVGTASMAPNTWTWLNYQGSTTTDIMKYTFTGAGSKSVKVYSKLYDVKVDKVVFIGADEQCSSNNQIPTGDGSNCDAAPLVTVGGESPAVPGGSTPPAPSPVTTPAVVAANSDNIQQVDYFVDGKLVQTVEGPKGFDTSLIPNGTYELTAKVTYKDGSTAQATENISVTNAPQKFGSVRRWFKQRGTYLMIAFGGVSMLAVAAGTLTLIRYFRHRKMFALHHGLSH